MHLELQVGSSALLALLRNRIRQQIPCIPQTFVEPLGGQTLAVVVDHIEVGDDASFRRKHGVSIPVYESSLTGDVIQLKQPLSVYLASLFDLAAADTEPLASTEYIRIDVALLLDIQVAQSKDGWHLAFTLDDVQSAIAIPDSIMQALTGAVQNLAPSTPLDVSALNVLIGSAEVAQAGVGADKHLTVLAFRLEINDGPREGFGEWQAFFDGIVAARLPIKWTTQAPPVVQFDADGKPIKNLTYQPPPVHHVIDGDWSLFVDAALLLPAIEAKIAANAGQGEFQLDQSSVDATWIPVDFNANLLVTFSGHVLAPITGVHIHLDVRASILLWIDVSNNTVVARLAFSYDPSFWDEVLAGVVDGILAAMGGAAIGEAGGPIGGVIGAVVGFVIGFVGTFIGASLADKSLPSTDQIKKIDDTTYSYTLPLPALSEPLVGTLTATQLVGLDDGALLVGSLEAGAEAVAPNITSVQMDGFAWGYHDPCGSPSLYADAAVSLSTDGAPLTLCNLTIPAGSDPLNVLGNAITITGGSGTSSTIDVDIAISADALSGYLTAPYPLQILIQTNGGARLVSIPAVGQPDQQALGLSLVAAKVGCTKTSDGFWNGSGYNVRWSVDPGPETVQLVRAAARGLAAGDDVQLRGASGKVLARAQANTAGFAVASAVVGGRQTSILVARGASAAREHRVVHEARRLTISRTPIRRVTSVRTHGACQAVKLGSVDGAVLLLCITSGGVHEVFDLSNPARPLWRLHFSLPGLRGVVRSGGRLILWGSAGLRVVTRDLRCERLPPAVARRLPAGPVRAVTTGSAGHLNVHMEDGTVVALQAWDATGTTVGLAPDVTPTAPQVADPWFDTASRAGRLLARVGALGAVEIWEAGRPIIVG